MKEFKILVLACISLLCLGSCKDYDDGIPFQVYEFSDNNVIVGSEASDVEIGITNINKLEKDWHIAKIHVTDDFRRDSLIHEATSLEELGDTFPTSVKWEWLTVRRTDNGKSLSIHVDENTGGQRKMVVEIGSLFDHGIFVLNQEKN